MLSNLLIVIFQIQLSHANSLIFTRLVGKTTQDTPYKDILVDDGIRCFGMCLQNSICLAFDYGDDVDDALNSNMSTKCRFFSLPFHETKMITSSNVTYYYHPMMLKDCLDWYENGHTQSGVYNVLISGKYAIPVYCDMDTAGGGWIVFQRRFNGKLDFNRVWEEYKWGFGDTKGEYWLGNEYVSELTSANNQEFFISATSFSNETNQCHYEEVFVHNEENGYELTFGAFRSIPTTDGSFSNVGLSKDQHSMYRMKFTTNDKDNDLHEKNCAIYFSNGWWYDRCFSENFNGPYQQNGTVVKQWHGVIWGDWKTMNKSLKSTKMMLRRRK